MRNQFERLLQPLVIGYMGSESHEPDLEFISPILKRLLDEFPDKIQIHIYGTKPQEFLLSKSQVFWIPIKTFDYELFSKDFQKLDFDISIAPLIDNLFNRCKSSIKYLEYSTLGVAGVYSKIDPYKDVVTDGNDGLLAGTLDEWYTQLKLLINDDELRYKLAVNAQRTVNDNWLISKNAYLWEQVYLEAHKEKKSGPGRKFDPFDIVQSISDQVIECDLRQVR